MDEQQRAAIMELPDVVHSHDRWWIAHLVWDLETSANPILRIIYSDG